MAKINTYSNKDTPAGADKLIGTDSEDSNSTKNFVLSNLISGEGVAEAYIFGNAVAATIDEVDEVHPVFSAITGVLSRFTRENGFEIAAGGVSAFADQGGGIVRVTTGSAHGLTTGDIVAQHLTAGTGSLTGVFIVTVIDATNYDITATFDGTATAGTTTLTKAAVFTALAGSDGDYLMTGQASLSAASPNDQFLVQAYIGITAQDKVASEAKFANNDLADLPLTGVLTVAEGDKIWIGFTNTVSAGNVTIKHANVTMTRLSLA